MDFPKIYNAEGYLVNPKNLLLHNGESQMIFSNEQDPSKISFFDLEKGKIVQQYDGSKKGVNF